MDDRVKILKEMRSAIKNDHLDAVVSLIESDRDILNMMTAFGTWLHVAATFGRLDIVKRLLDYGVDINARGESNNGRALDRAASEGHFEVVKYLLLHGAEMDVDEPERNPLFAAIHGGHLNIVKLLVESGIDVHVQYTGPSMLNMDALAFADERGQEEIGDYLKQFFPGRTDRHVSRRRQGDEP